VLLHRLTGTSSPILPITGQGAKLRKRSVLDKRYNSVNVCVSAYSMTKPCHWTVARIRVCLYVDSFILHRSRKKVHVGYNVAAGAILEIVRYSTLDGQRVMNTFFYRTPVSIADAQDAMSEIANEFESQVHQPIILAQSEDLFGTRLRLQWVHPLRFMFFDRACTVGQGQVMTASMTVGASVVVRRRSDVASRSARGRIYIPGIPFASQSASQLTAGFMAGAGAAIAAAIPLSLTIAILGFDLFPVIWSYGDPTHHDNITSAQVDTVIRYQRRREVGVGQ